MSPLQMKTLKIGAAALNQTPLDWAGNRKNIEHAIESAKKKKIELLCLPELSLSGYGCEDAFYAHHVSQKAWGKLNASCASNPKYNSSCWFAFKLSKSAV